MKMAFHSIDNKSWPVGITSSELLFQALHEKSRRVFESGMTLLKRHDDFPVKLRIKDL